MFGKSLHRYRINQSSTFPIYSCRQKQNFFIQYKCKVSLNYTYFNTGLEVQHIQCLVSQRPRKRKRLSLTSNTGTAIDQLTRQNTEYSKTLQHMLCFILFRVLLLNENLMKCVNANFEQLYCQGKYLLKANPVCVLLHVVALTT